MDCQITYWDNHKCPPLIEKRKKRERAARRQRQQQGEDQKGSGPGGLPLEIEPAGSTSGSQ